MGRSHRRSSSDRDRYRDKERSRDRSKDRHRDKDRDRDHYRSKRSRSRSRSKSYYSSSSRSKKSKKSYRRNSSSSSDEYSRSSRSMSNKSRSVTRAVSSDKFIALVTASTSSSTASSSKPLKSLDILENRLTATVLGSIEEDTFTPQAFVSGADKKVSDKVYINLKNETMAIPVQEKVVDNLEDYNFNPQFLGDQQTKMDKWIKKLHNYRKREAFL